MHFTYYNIPITFVAASYSALFMQKYNRLKAVLADKGRTSKWLADQVSRSKATVSRWCSNQIQPPLEVLFKIAEILEVDVCELLVKEKK
ncbi:MAG: hypothetical protein DHS20C18_38950 [Saprospiraceae bacterium]|nr:MAG: hypothetical protein DHS20C18_38950 [Saprospiraceae bacterium]